MLWVRQHSVCEEQMAKQLEWAGSGPQRIRLAQCSQFEAVQQSILAFMTHQSEHVFEHKYIFVFFILLIHFHL